jgi:hypothetical protein
MYPLKRNQSYALAQPVCSPAAIGITIFLRVLVTLIARKFSTRNHSSPDAAQGVVLTKLF